MNPASFARRLGACTTESSCHFWARNLTALHAMALRENVKNTYLTTIRVPFCPGSTTAEQCDFC